MNRAEILESAKAIVTTDRDEQYGEPEDSFELIATLWAGYLWGRGAVLNYLTPHDVAAMMALLKIARIATGAGKADNWIDLAGYAACGGECQTGRKTQTSGSKKKKGGN